MTALTSANTVNGRSRLREAVLPTLVGIAVMAASLLNLLGSQQYPILTTEVAIFVAALASVALAMGLLYAVSDSISRALFQFLLLFFALDLNFDGWGVLIGSMAVAVVVNRHMMPFLGIASLVVILTEIPGTTFVRSSEASAVSIQSRTTGNITLPPLVHILLDEHIGPEGLTSDDAALALRDRLKSFYVSNGFHLSGGAYSEYLHTVNAIPALLNFGEEQPWLPNTSKEGTAVPTNRYFEYLNELGYAINVYQTPYVDFCVHAAVDACRTSPESFLLALASDTISPSDKALLLGTEFARRSRTVRLVNDVMGGSVGMAANLRESRLPMAGPSVETLGMVADQLRRSAGGTAFFVHVLFPHYPYVLDGTCGTKPVSMWRHRRSTFAAQDTLLERQAAYIDQVDCLLKVLRPIFDAAGDNAIIIIEGDHGSRITDIDPRADTLGQFSDSDMIAGFSTLHAVRAPGVAPGYDRRPLPASFLLREFVQSGFQNANPQTPAGFAATVTLDRADWRPVHRHPLPGGWPSVQ